MPCQSFVLNKVWDLHLLVQLLLLCYNCIHLPWQEVMYNKYLSRRWCTNSTLSTRYEDILATSIIVTLIQCIYTVYRAVCDSLHSSLGCVVPQPYQHYPQHPRSFPVGPTHQPTYPQPSNPGYPPPGHQYSCTSRTRWNTTSALSTRWRLHSCCQTVSYLHVNSLCI